MRVWMVESGPRSGDYNMALDEVLLDRLRAETATSEPQLVVRTYLWERPTLSLGVNQSVRDVPELLTLYSDASGETPGLVRRPTGGRGILHGRDISFSFITNDPALLRQNLKDSYCHLTKFVSQALTQCALQIQCSAEQSERAYLRSPVCFQTQTPSDLLGPNGEKLVGSAQLRRAGGLLQHGAAFIQAYDISPETFSRALIFAVSAFYNAEAQPYDLAVLNAGLNEKIDAYRNESRGILASVSTTAGSHFTPASR